MLRLIKLFQFHFKLFSQNNYFLTTVILSTSTLFIMQYLVAYSQHQVMNDVAWLRAGIFGLWASGTTAAGVIGMQKWQGTLMYLVNNPLSDYASLVALVMPAASFGLFSFLVAFLLTVVFNIAVTITAVDILCMLLLWIGGTILDFCIAAIFVVTTRAIIYEEIISLPVLLLSGVFTLPSIFTPFQQAAQWFVPISMPIQWLLRYEDMSLLGIVKYMCAISLGLAFSYYFTRHLIRKSKELGRIGGKL